MRVFTGIALPDSIKDELAAFRETRIPTARWEHHDDFHLTLRFIGDVDTATYERYKAALGSVKSVQFELGLKGVGRFPIQEKRPPSVLWVGVQPSPALTDLQTKVSAALDAAGLPKDKFESYSPHITLARLRTEHRLEELDRFLLRYQSFQTSLINVNEFVMYQRDPSSNGPHYKRIASFPLSR